ncbi:hypothetical protein [Chryseobacterium luquanense]|uniref:Uncharacterized protein n=1 Tax=Chryseobacterium luquanense TaxID=2983766 RepID=A0ABT3Y1F5_9FLAO|nr:hypothetical protein [Chryseobacterium luquanense]MCX8531971.1 hypothetical protein [Chryseobacterium luquanense]
MKFSVISILLSLITILLSIKVNVNILNYYLSTDGKTQALFGLTELKYSYKYYFLIISLISSLFLFLAFKTKELKKFKYLGIFILSSGIASVFIGFWKWFV